MLQTDIFLLYEFYCHSPENFLTGVALLANAPEKLSDRQLEVVKKSEEVTKHLLLL